MLETVRWVCRRRLVHRPHVVFWENVRALMSKSAKRGGRKLVKHATKKLRACGYEVHWKMMDASRHGLPQARRRVIGVALLRSRLVRKFSWPVPCSLAFSLHEMQDVHGPSDRPWRLPRMATAAGKIRVRTLAQKAVKESTMKRGHMPSFLAVDIDCSLRFRRWSAGPALFCLTASRG